MTDSPLMISVSGIRTDASASGSHPKSWHGTRRRSARGRLRPASHARSCSVATAACPAASSTASRAPPFESVGADVIDIGLTTTPTLQMAVEHHHAAGGLCITASHNPIEWNALKCVGPAGLFLNADEARRDARVC